MKVMEKVENRFMVDILKVRLNILWSFVSVLLLKQFDHVLLMRRGLLIVHFLHETNAA